MKEPQHFCSTAKVFHETVDLREGNSDDEKMIPFMTIRAPVILDSKRCRQVRTRFVRT